VLSNQSGIGRGLLSEADALRVNARIAELLREQGVDILAWYMCPHAPEVSCDCRKPLRGWRAPLPGTGSWISAAAT